MVPMHPALACLFGLSYTSMFNATAYSDLFLCLLLQVNELFVSLEHLHNPVQLPAAFVQAVSCRPEHFGSTPPAACWRPVYFGSSAAAICRGMNCDQLTAVFKTGSICIRSYNIGTRTTAPLPKYLEPSNIRGVGC